jgi:hypothetical protein
MPVLTLNSSDTARSEPKVWLSKIVLYKSLDPIEEIRNVQLHTGINVVWGIEGAGSDEQLQPGHGVGKTTFCRLVRYCLGESSFGQRHAVAEVRNTFPDGYVGAVMRVAEETWAVLRPFGHHRASYAKKADSIEELLAVKPHRQSYPDFRSHLAQLCLHGIRADAVLSGSASILWEHLLAMCSRDQEARYQDLWNWRSSRSDSDSLALKQPKVDALLCLRAVLGLLPEEETTLQSRLHSLALDVSRLEGEIAERRREPDYWIRRLRRELEVDFGCESAMQVTLDSSELFGLPQIVQRRIAALEKQHIDVDAALVPLQRQISLAAASLQEPAELQAQEEVAAKVTDDGTEALLATIRELEESRRDIQLAEFSLCKYGNVSIGDCDYAKRRLLGLDDEITESRRTESMRGAARDQATAALRERIQRRTEAAQKLRGKLTELEQERERLLQLRRDAVSDAKAIRNTLNRLLHWNRLTTGQEADSELGRLMTDRKMAAENEVEKKAELSALLKRQDEHIGGLRQIHGDLVKSALSPAFVGRVNLTEDGLDFRVFRGESLSGEAFETLSILLADLTVLLMGALNHARHPGFLIHDSPREADLGGAIYSKLLLTVANIANELRGSKQVPFQYIVTTTTPPPEPLQTDERTRLRLGSLHGLLFGCQLKTAPQDAQRKLLSESVDLDSKGLA